MINPHILGAALRWNEETNHCVWSQKKKKKSTERVSWSYLFHRRARSHSVQFLQMFQEKPNHFLLHIAHHPAIILKYWKFVFSNYIEQWTHLQQGSNKQQISCIIDIISPNQNHKYGMHPYKSSNAFLCFLLFIFYLFFPISLAPFFWEGVGFLTITSPRPQMIGSLYTGCKLKKNSLMLTQFNTSIW